MGRRMSAKNYNKMLNSYHFFNTEADALAYVKANRWRKYTLSSNIEGTCWTLYHKER